jgi:hypothetical protein
VDHRDEPVVIHRANIHRAFLELSATEVSYMLNGQEWFRITGMLQEDTHGSSHSEWRTNEIVSVADGVVTFKHRVHNPKQLSVRVTAVERVTSTCGYEFKKGFKYMVTSNGSQYMYTPKKDNSSELLSMKKYCVLRCYIDDVTMVPSGDSPQRASNPLPLPPGGH